MLLLADLLATLAGAHTPRATVRAIAATLTTRVPLARVELGPADRRVIVEASGDGWRHVEAAARGPASVEVAPGLALAPRGELPGFFAEAGFRAVLARVIEAAGRHLTVVQRVAELSRRAHGVSRELRADLDRLAAGPIVVARSAAMRSVLERAALVARHPTTVLLTGESGSGKEVVAREVHRLSPRARRPMLHLNCGAIPDALIESELFGHERGAFTGADRAHPGIFERAHRGTLLLDEVGELPLAAQVKLLRVLQERQLRRVGGIDPIDVDVRVIAATNRPLAAMVRDGSFREDLYYRLAVFTIALPPLRERRADLGPLVAALVRELAGRLDIPVPPISRPVMARLEAHDWPGNVRELANLLEASLILGNGRALSLPDDFSAAAPRRDTASPRLDTAVRRAIEDALHSTRGVVYGAGGAAARLGLKPGTLQSKMRKLGIRRDAFTT